MLRLRLIGQMEAWTVGSQSVLPTGRVDDGLAIASQPNVALACFGDMMRVPGTKGTPLELKARGADIRIDHRQVHANRQVRQRTAQDQRTGSYVVPRHAVTDVDHARRRADLGDHRVADARETIRKPVIRQEGDQRGFAHGALLSPVVEGPAVDFQVVFEVRSVDQLYWIL